MINVPSIVLRIKKNVAPLNQEGQNERMGGPFFEKERVFYFTL